MLADPEKAFQIKELQLPLTTSTPETSLVCDTCKKSLQIKDFRRWKGSKKILASTCNACAGFTKKGTRPLSKMDYKARMNEAGHGRAHIFVVQKSISEEKAKRSARRKDVAQRRARDARLSAWKSQIFAPLRKEIAWAQRGLRRPACTPVQHELLTYYLTLLKERIGALTVSALAGAKVPNGVEPTPLMSLFTQDEVTRVRRLYAATGRECLLLRNPPLRPPLLARGHQPEGEST